MSDDPRTHRANTIGLAVGAVVIAILATLLILTFTADLGRQSPIAGDPPIYDAIAEQVLRGEIPYINTPVEHLPGAVVPILLIGGFSQFSNINILALWPLAMGVLFVISVAIAGRLPASFDAGRRYILLSLPLLPLVLFRIEPWLMVWVVASIGLAFKSSWFKSSVTAVIASLIKGWPIVLLGLPFRSGQRRVALWSGLVTIVILMGVSLLPGFREGRTFDGIHTETFVGSLLLVYRGLRGMDTQLIGAAGAWYVAAGTWAVVLNFLIGLPFILLGFRALSKTSDTAAQTIAIGLSVLGIVIASPLFSAQFVFWLVPFVLFLALGHRNLYLVASVATLLTIVWWNPAVLSWNVLVVGRNGLLIVLAVVWALSLREEALTTRLFWRSTPV